MTVKCGNHTIRTYHSNTSEVRECYAIGLTRVESRAHLKAEYYATLNQPTMTEDHARLTAVEVRKVCGKCKWSQPVTEFAKRTASKDGLQNWCRECHAEYSGS